MCAVMILTSLCFGGCNNSGAQAQFDFKLDTSKEVNLNFIGGLENFEALEAVIEKFETKYSNCHITYEYVNEYGKNLATRLQSDSANTHLFLSTKSNFNEEFFRNTAVDFNDYATNGVNTDNTRAMLTDSQEIDGKLYLVPLAMTVRGIVVNKTLLKENNVAVPTNWNEFLAACDTLKNKGYIPIQTQNNALLINLFYPNIAVSLVHDADSEKKISELDAYTPGSSQYLKTFFEKAFTIIDKGYTSCAENASVEDSYEDVILNFFEGDVAFAPCTTETVSGMKKRETKSEAFTAKPFEYEFFASPTGDDGYQTYWQVWNCVSVNKECDNENWARAFANFMLEEENLTLLAQVKGLPANTKNNPSDERFRSLFDVDEAHSTEATKFQINFYSCINDTLKAIGTESSTEGHISDIDGALAFFEEKLAAKKAS